jgi:predicted helicase
MRSATTLRKERGLYATPAPVVGFITRSVDLLLQSRFGRPAGLADRAVRLLDPAAGAMNFVLAACRRAVSQHRQGRAGLEPLVREHLLPHFQGLEVVPAEQERGRLAMRRCLAALGISPRAGERVSLFLADALAGPGPEPLTLPGKKCVTVIVGNPPWRGHSTNRGPWITGLLRGYRLPDGSEEEGYHRVDGEPLGERNPKWLQDDYVKFLRFAQWKVDQSGQGIVGFVVNHNGLDAPTFRGLRRSLLRSFQEIYALDLHGNRRKREAGPGGGPDENVFPGIAQGAAVLLLVKNPGLRRRVFRADLYGTRREKLHVLDRESVETIPWRKIRPRSPGYLFVAGDERIERDYRRGLSLPEIFPVHSVGIVTGRDALVTGLDRRTCEEQVGRLREEGATALDASRRERLREDSGWRRRLTAYLARPFDVRHLLYAPYLLERPRQGVMVHLASGANVALIVPRQCKEEPGAFVTRWIAGHKVVSAYDISTVFPLYLHPETERVPNLAPGLPRRLGELYGQAPEAGEILGYVYAVLYSPPYRRRYRDLLRRSFPRVPFPRERELFGCLARLGSELIGLHLLEDPRLMQIPLPMEGDGRKALGATRRTLCDYRAAERRLHVNGQGLHFEGIEPEVWAFRIGAYPVLSRWLQARAGRVLCYGEIRDFRCAAVALRLTLAVQDELARTYGELEGSGIDLGEPLREGARKGHGIAA